MGARKPDFLALEAVSLGTSNSQAGEFGEREGLWLALAHGAHMPRASPVPCVAWLCKSKGSSSQSCRHPNSSSTGVL